MNGARAVRTHVTFRTDRFNQTVVGKDFINDCCFGEDCAAWLVAELRGRGWTEIEEPWQEDWGWQTVGERHARRYLVSVGLVHDEDPLWLVHVQESRRLLARVTGRVGPSLLQALVVAIHAAVTTLGDVQDVRWHFADVYMKGRGAGQPEPLAPPAADESATSKPR